jgi:N-acetylglucosamine malate deacetylase 1
MTVDILAFGAHPDDAEIGCGALLLKLKDRGYRTGIIYLTVGEMGSRGTPEVRRQELMAAAKALGLDHVQVLDFQDCQIVDDFESRLKIARVVRQQRPILVLAPYWEGPPGRGVGHTDHQATGYLVSHGVNFAHLRALPLEGAPHSVANIFYFLFPREMAPSFVVDVSDYLEQWVEVLKCHHSQFYSADTGRYDFIDTLVAVARARGLSIGARYAQGFIAAEPLKVDDPFMLATQRYAIPQYPT